MDLDLVSRTYDAHAPAVYGVLMRVLECEECSSAALERAFVKLFSAGGDPPRLHQLMACAFSCCCEGAGDQGRAAMQARIQAWFTERLREQEFGKDIPRSGASPSSQRNSAHGTALRAAQGVPHVEPSL